MDDCVFCKLISREFATNVLYEDDKTFVFLSNAPVVEGHTLIVPKMHATDLSDIADDDLAAVMTTTKRMANLYKEHLGIDGFHTKNNNGLAGDQEVFHFHMHLIPRYKNDDIDFLSPSEKAAGEGDNEAMAAFAKKIRGLV